MPRKICIVGLFLIFLVAFVTFIIGGGGSSGLVYVRHRDVYSSSDGLFWTCITRNTPWGGKAYHNAVVHNDKIYLVTGNH